MIEGQILWDIRALVWMRHNRSSVAESFNCDLRAYIEGDQWFQTLSEVGSFHFASQCSVLEPFPTPNAKVMGHHSADFPLKYSGLCIFLFPWI